MRTLVALVLSIVVIPVGPLSSQTLTRLDSASRVRVTAPAYGLRAQIATVVAHRADTLWVRALPRGDTLALPVGELTRVELSRGKHGLALRGATIGFVSGAVLGGLLGYTSEPTDPEECAETSCRGVATLALAVVGGLAGTLTGAIVGAIHTTEQWQILIAKLTPPTVSTHRPSTQRLSIGLHRTF